LQEIKLGAGGKKQIIEASIIKNWLEWRRRASFTFCQTPTKPSKNHYPKVQILSVRDIHYGNDVRWWADEKHKVSYPLGGENYGATGYAPD